MRQHRPLPPQEIIHDLFRYDGKEGRLYWRNPRCARYRPGEAVKGTTRHDGYNYIGVNGYGQIGAHRIIWIYNFGCFDIPLEIDHIDGNPYNNHIGNLRLATSSQQKMNKRVQSNNRCGLKGAYYHAAHKGKKWRSQIKYEGRYVFLGYYHTPEEAHAAYRAASAHYYGEFARAA